MILCLIGAASALDLKISSFFYHDNSFYENGLTTWLYHWGETFGFIFGILATIGFVVSYCFKRCFVLKKGCLVIGLTLFLGAGVLINGLLKTTFGRPRPRHLTCFGKTQEYRPFYRPSLHPKDRIYKSFPSGHVAMGCLYLVLYFIGLEEKRRLLQYLGLTLGIGFGVLVAFARIAVGAHFLTDALFSWIIMIYVIRFSIFLVYRTAFVSTLENLLLSRFHSFLLLEKKV